MASPTDADGINAALAIPNNVPPGNTFDFMAENQDRPAVIAILFVGAFSTLIVALRCYARVFFVKRFGLDDWLALLTLIPYLAFIALCIDLIHLGSGRHFVFVQYVLDNRTINLTEVLDFAAHIIYTTTLLICRLSGLAFYASITDRHDRLTWAVRAAAVFMVAGYLPQLFLIIFHCLPVTGWWPYAFQPEVNNFTCLQWGTVYVTNSAISVVCDLILFTIPTLIIVSLRGKSTKQKLRLSLILMPGLLVIGISCARMYLVVIGQWEADESWSYDPLLAVEVSEIGSTIIALSVPSLKPFFGTVFDGLLATHPRNYFRSRSKGSGLHSSRRTEDDVIELDPRLAYAETQISFVKARRDIDAESQIAIVRTVDVKQSQRSSADDIGAPSE